MSTTIPTRSEIPESDTWDLTKLFLTEEEYRNSFARLKDLYPKIADYKTHLDESAKRLFECLECEKSLDQIAERLGH